ncbi:MAG: VCBS repeat-containing protein [Saprospiraceae bacterium]|nr:VCBS repeat-containing protein [Saprospiraceae bacterium]
MYKKILYLSILLIIVGCSSDNSDAEQLFTLMDSGKTGIKFSNDLTFDRDFNIYTYRNFYNGGGVAIGDINNDSLPDVYLTANMGPNKLYLNKGNLRFEDITDEAGVPGTRTWSTGVTFVDINGDNYLDIYVCNSGDPGGEEKQNELFINNGDGTFKEAAAQYGIDDQGYSTHAVFFDYDKDGDLDLYLLNNSYQAIGSFNLRRNQRGVRDKEGGDKLYRNDGSNFTDVSEQAGIYGSVIGFGLGVTVGDINMDSWPDIYVSNDFFEKDYIYINNGDGTFSEDMESYLSSISVASMGADMADINNDAKPDIFVTEMLPGEDRRLKTKTTFEDWDKYQYSLKNDYYHQFTRNMLHVNNGDGSFTELGRYADVHATDWSWGALISDYDNDGLKDLYVTNGIYQDLTDQDFLNYISNEEVMKSMVEGNKVDYEKLIEVIPSERISNYAFHNQGASGFRNTAEEWGLNTPSHSNGAAYGDLDNDGDLDLIVNNVNMPLFFYRNNGTENNFIQFSLEGKGGNTRAIGSKVYLYTTAGLQYQDYMPMKGFQSSMDYLIHFGVGIGVQVDSVIISWPDDQLQTILNPEVNKRHYLSQPGNGLKFTVSEIDLQGILSDVSSNFSIPFKHEEKPYVDFDRDRLLYLMRSTEGPLLLTEDFNSDGREDIFVGGASGQSPALLLQDRQGQFNLSQTSFFEDDAENENLHLSSGDFDGDGDFDIYATAGSMEFSGQSSGLRDKMYINEGKGQFARKTNSVLPGTYINTSAVAVDDFDGDGDLDLFVGERMKSQSYGVPADGYLLENSGNGNFTDVTSQKASGLKAIGMIRDATWADIDSDGVNDLVVVGEYMPIKIFKNIRDSLVDITEDMGFENSEGWWNTVEVVDIDKDGDLDIIAGNHGTNSRFKSTIDRPVCMHVNDFDLNGSIEQILCVYEGDRSYPLALRHDLIRQLPHIKKRYLSYKEYANQTIEDIFTPEERKNMITLFARELRTSLYLNDGGTYIRKELPVEIQYAPVYALHIQDINGDGNLDILAGGNLFRVKPEIGRYDSSRGITLLGKGDGNFEYLPNAQSGFTVEGEIRDIDTITIRNKEYIIVTRNNDTVKIFETGQIES